MGPTTALFASRDIGRMLRNPKLSKVAVGSATLAESAKGFSQADRFGGWFGRGSARFGPQFGRLTGSAGSPVRTVRMRFG